MKLFIAACLAFTISIPLAAEPSASAKDQRDITAVIEAFRLGIINKDKTALDKLPVNQNISFMAAVDPETLATVRKRRPEAKRLVVSSYPEFVQEVTSGSVPQEEVFSDISIQSNGSIANVYFAYRFKENGEVTNWGHENWGLLATDEGWKISSVIWSIAFTPNQP